VEALISPLALWTTRMEEMTPAVIKRDPTVPMMVSTLPPPPLLDPFLVGVV